MGPDGKRYATSGEVEIDSSPEDGDPEATIRKMDTVIRAALSPADPSPQDLQVARDAQTARSKAQIELTKKREAEREQGNSDDAANATAPGEEPACRDARTESAIAAYQQAAGAETAVSIYQIIQSA